MRKELFLNAAVVVLMHCITTGYADAATATVAAPPVSEIAKKQNFPGNVSSKQAAPVQAKNNTTAAAATITPKSAAIAANPGTAAPPNSPVLTPTESFSRQSSGTAASPLPTSASSGNLNKESSGAVAPVNTPVSPRTESLNRQSSLPTLVSSSSFSQEPSFVTTAPPSSPTVAEVKADITASVLKEVAEALETAAAKAGQKA